MVFLLINRHQPRYVDVQRVKQFLRVETFRVYFPLDTDLKRLFHKAMGHQLLNKKALIPTCIHRRRCHTIEMTILPIYSWLPTLSSFSRKCIALMFTNGFSRQSNLTTDLGSARCLHEESLGFFQKPINKFTSKYPSSPQVYTSQCRLLRPSSSFVLSPSAQQSLKVTVFLVADLFRTYDCNNMTCFPVAR